LGLLGKRLSYVVVITLEECKVGVAGTSLLPQRVGSSLSKDEVKDSTSNTKIKKEKKKN
jgi:hypothetical protein